VGGFTHFGFALLKDGVPQVHRNAEFQVVHNGQVIFATTDTHEYDGLFSFDVVFPAPGAYEVMATSEGMTMGMFNGTVVEPVNATVASIEFESVPDSLPLSGGFTGTLRIVDADGALINHTDAIVEVREAMGARLVSRVRTHIHDAPMVFTQFLPTAGDYTMQVTAFRAFPTGRSGDFEAVVQTFDLTAGPVHSGIVAPAPTEIADNTDPLAPSGPMASADGFTLHGMYDPQNLIGIGNVARLSAILVDENGTAVPHVDFKFRLDGPTGRVFDS
jgi:hypothetical protein